MKSFMYTLALIALLLLTQSAAFTVSPLQRLHPSPRDRVAFTVDRSDLNRDITAKGSRVIGRGARSGTQLVSED